MYFTSTVIISLLGIAQLAAGHGAIIKAVGDQGGAGSAIGINPNTPRNGTRRNPFQQDTTRFRGANKATCGQTLGGGENDIQAGTQQVLAQNGGQLPQISPGGTIQMTLHQVNGDGAGPYACMIDASGTGTQWTAIQVTQQVPGTRGNNRATAVTDLPLNAAIPQNQTCSGTVAGQSNVCMIRCQNPARAGPFGGCVPVQMAGGAAAPAGNGNPPPAAGNGTAPVKAPTVNSQQAKADEAAADAMDRD